MWPDIPVHALVDECHGVIRGFTTVLETLTPQEEIRAWWLKSGQESMAGELKGPKDELPVVNLLSGHSFLKFVCL